MNIRTLLFLASAFFLCLYGAPMVLDELDTSELVFGGTRAQLGQFPMQVFISFMNTAAKQPDLCGGTLLSTTHVLTAAHCAVFMGAPHKVMVGSTNRNDTSSKAQWRNIARIRPHPGYKRGKIAVYNDVAVLELDKPVKLSSAVKIVKIVRNDAQLLKQKTATVVGFGIHGYQGKKYSLHEHLLYTQVGLIAFEYCNGMWGNTLKEKEMVCAGSKGRGAGFGDSGGPLLASHNGQFYQIGVTSFLPGDKDMQLDQATYPAVFMRVSFFCSFIESATGKAVRCT